MSAKIVVEVDQIGPSASEGSARSHRVPIDRPVPKGGEDRGPMGGELLLMSLGGCFMSNLLAAIRAREAAVGGVRIGIEGVLGDSPQRFEAVVLTVTADYEDADLMAKLITIADRACIVTNTLRPALDLSIVLGPAREKSRD
jgi:putative redox protein